MSIVDKDKEILQLQQEVRTWKKSYSNMHDAQWSGIKRQRELMKQIKLLEDLVFLQKQYIDLMGEELGEVVQIANVHGWKSTRYEKGMELRKLIEEHNDKLSKEGELYI